jgi:hypothetical protein
MMTIVMVIVMMMMIALAVDPTHKDLPSVVTHRGELRVVAVQ